ncbi:MAG: ribonuclease P protein component [Flavobacteriales bacterium]|nr:ribonuclease P protein component [Flavobacteriales bacterium]
MELNNKYAKNEKLKSKKAIDLLFSNGKSINAFPIRVIYISKPELEGIPVNMGVTVSKKNIKLAVNRNLIKRRVREAYRLNNNELKTYLLNANSELNIMFIYTSKQILPYKEIEDKIKVLLTRLIELSEVVSE